MIDNKDYPWNRIRLPSTSEGPLEGYVTAPDFRSPIDYRGRFERQSDGTWLMMVFIAGD